MSGTSFENDEELLTALRELSAAVYEDPGYHTPKNIFNPAMTKTIERPSRCSILSQKSSPPPHSSSSDENPYSSLKKDHIPRWDIEALVTRDPRELPSPEPSRSSKALMTARRYVKTLDSCDYALGVALFFTIVLFIIGLIVLFA